MLGKLLKYEFKNTYKIGILMILALELITIISIGFFYLPIWRDAVAYGDASWQVFVTFMVGMCVFTMDIFVIYIVKYGVTIMNGFFYYKSMFSNQGYLTNTLPVKPIHHLLAKTISGGFWAVLTAVITYVNCCIIILIGVLQIGSLSNGNASYLYVAKMVLSSMMEDLGMESFVFVVLFWVFVIVISMVLMIISEILGVCILYGGLSLGQLSNAGKLILGILAYCVITFIQRTIASTLAMVASMVAFIIHPVLGQSISFLITGVVSLIVGIVMFFVAKYVLENKLNLE